MIPTYESCVLNWAHASKASQQEAPHGGVWRLANNNFKRRDREDGLKDNCFDSGLSKAATYLERRLTGVDPHSWGKTLVTQAQERPQKSSPGQVCIPSHGSEFEPIGRASTLNLTDFKTNKFENTSFNSQKVKHFIFWCFIIYNWLCPNQRSAKND